MGGGPRPPAVSHSLDLDVAKLHPPQHQHESLLPGIRLSVLHHSPSQRGRGATEMRKTPLVPSGRSDHHCEEGGCCVSLKTHHETQRIHFPNLSQHGWGRDPMGLLSPGPVSSSPPGHPNKPQLTPCLGRPNGGPALLEPWRWQSRELVPQICHFGSLVSQNPAQHLVSFYPIRSHRRLGLP